MICSRLCHTRDTFRLPDCWSPTARIGIVMQMPQRYSVILGLLRWSIVAAKKCWVHCWFACPTFLRQTFVKWAGSTIPRSFWAAAYYQQRRNKRCTHLVSYRFCRAILESPLLNLFVRRWCYRLTRSINKHPIRILAHPHEILVCQPEIRFLDRLFSGQTMHTQYAAA